MAVASLKRGRGRPRKASVINDVVESIDPSESRLNASESISFDLDALHDAAEPVIGLGDDDLPIAPKTLTENLKDRIKGFFNKDHADDDDATPEPKKRGRPSKSNPGADFIDSMLPIMTMLLVMLLGAPYPLPYKACAPTKTEAESIALPPLRILARHMKFTALNPDTWDCVKLVTALILYGERALQTAQIISLNLQQERQGLDGESRGEHTGQYQGAYARDPGDGRGSPFPAYPGAGPYDDGRLDTETPTGPGQDESSGNALIRDLLEQDSSGRRRLGLIG